MRHRLWPMLISVVLAAPALAVEDGDVLFFAPFEGTLEAAIAGGSPLPNVLHEVSIVDGVRGSAVRVADRAMLEYVFPGNAIADEGTVMMWFRAEWPADDDLFHYFFHANSGNDRGKALNAVQLYKYPKWARLLFYTSNGELTGPQAGRTMAYRNE